MPRKSVNFIDPDEVMTIHAMVTYLIDDIDSVNDRDFNRLLTEVLEQAHLRRVFHVVEEFMTNDGYDIF